VVTNTGNPPAAFATAGLPATTAHTIVHFTVWNTKSQAVHNFNVTLTAHDVFSCSLLDLLVNTNKLPTPCGLTPAPASVISQLTVGSILTGYVTADVVTETTTSIPGQPGYPFANWNLLIGHQYLVDLPAGSASGFNAVSIESASAFDAKSLGQPMDLVNAEPLGFYLNKCLDAQGGGAASPCAPAPSGSYGNRERIDGSTGTILQRSAANATGPITAANDRPLSLLLRYFSLTAIGARSEIWLWKDRNTTGQAANVSVSVYDEDEIVTTRTLPIPDQVNSIGTENLVSAGTPGGWLRIRFNCTTFGYCGYNFQDPAGTTASSAPWITTANPPVLQTPIQAVAYSVQSANSANAALRWDAVFPAHRQYQTYVGGIAAE
jgi:hypothetical protein